MGTQVGALSRRPSAVGGGHLPRLYAFPRERPEFGDGRPLDGFVPLGAGGGSTPWPAVLSVGAIVDHQPERPPLQPHWLMVCDQYSRGTDRQPQVLADGVPGYGWHDHRRLLTGRQDCDDHDHVLNRVSAVDPPQRDGGACYVVWNGRQVGEVFTLSPQTTQKWYLERIVNISERSGRWAR